MKWKLLMAILSLLSQLRSMNLLLFHFVWKSDRNKPFLVVMKWVNCMQTTPSLRYKLIAFLNQRMPLKGNLISCCLSQEFKGLYSLKSLKTNVGHWSLKTTMKCFDVVWKGSTLTFWAVQSNGIAFWGRQHEDQLLFHTWRLSKWLRVLN